MELLLHSPFHWKILQDDAGKYIDVLECPGPRASDDILRFQKQSSFRKHMFEYRNPLEKPISSSMFRGLRVLTDDNKKKMLNDVNRLVTESVSTGFQCLGALGPSLTTFQVVSQDLQMPGMDEFEVALRVRKFHSRSWLLIIALRPTASSEEQVRYLPIGGNEWSNKETCSPTWRSQ